MTAQLTSVGDRTKVEVKTDLTVTGKVAQFGRGVMADVSAKLMGQFADNLEKLLEEDNADPGADTGIDAAPALTDVPGPNGVDAPDTTGPARVVTDPASVEAAPVSTGPRKINMPEPKAVDLLDTAGAPVLKRLAPVLGVLLALFLLRRKLRRK